MTETEIARLNERVARALGWIPSHDQRMFPGQWESPGLRITQTIPDFYHDIRLCGEMMEWLRTKELRSIEPFGYGWDVNMKNRLTFHGALSACLCSAIDAVAKGREM